MKALKGSDRVAVPVQLDDSDSLNISQRARWVVCPLGSTRGHGRRVIYPRQVREKKIQCSNGSFPAAWLLGQRWEEQGDLFIFSLALLAIFW